MFSCWRSKTNTHHKASINQRYNFIIVGSARSGKTTLCKELLRHHFPKVNIAEAETPIPPNGELSEVTEVGQGQIIDGDTQTTITVLDSPSISGTLYSRNYIDTIEEYIQTQNKIYEKRKRSNRPHYQANDTRVHCCIFVCAPNRFTIADRQFILRCHWKVPIVPVISKVDTMTRNELARQIKVMVTILDEHAMRVFDFGEERDIDVSWIDRLAICEIAIHLRRYRRFLKESGCISNDDVGGHKYNYSMVEQMMLDTSSHKDIQNILSGDSRDNLLYQARGKHISGQPRAYNIFSIVSNEYRSNLSDPAHSDTPRLYGLLFQKETLRRLKLRAEVRDPRWLTQSYEIHPARGIFFVTIISCTLTFIYALYNE